MGTRKVCQIAILVLLGTLINGLPALGQCFQPSCPAPAAVVQCAPCNPAPSFVCANSAAPPAAAGYVMAYAPVVYPEQQVQPILIVDAYGRWVWVYPQATTPLSPTLATVNYRPVIAAQGAFVPTRSYPQAPMIVPTTTYYPQPTVVTPMRTVLGAIFP